MRFDQAQLNDLNSMHSDKSAEEVLKWTLDNLHPHVALASSFGAEDVVLIDMLTKINPEARIFTLDTGRLNQETYDIMDNLRSKYKIKFEVMFPNQDDVEAMVREHGMNLFYRSQANRKLCCGIRKVNPLTKILSTLDGWITGIRGDQTQNRANANKFEIDNQFGGILKANPLIDWTWDQVWDYIKANKVPYNKLHDNGYPSIGCEPCTRAVKEGEDPRAGRWWWESESDKECGLHMDHRE
ncbi:MAG TPA: phosphoadenylyl-sulfate reductase [Thermodesulfobacteriota bacterium]